MVTNLRLLSIAATLLIVITADAGTPQHSQLAMTKNSDNSSGNDDFPDTLGGGGLHFHRQVKRTLAVAQPRHLTKALHRLHIPENSLNLR